VNALVTGATGFIGAALVKQLLREGHRVSVLVRDEKKVDKSLKSKVEIYKADISDLPSLENVFLSTKRIDTIFHLAACLNYKARKEKLYLINTEGTSNLLNVASKHRIKKFVFASSIEASGPLLKRDIPADETHICKPINSYGRSKFEAEKQAIGIGNKSQIQLVILRLGNVYGPGSLSFISPLISAILNEDKRYLYLNREQYRWHPVYVEDAVDGIVKSTSTKRANEIYILSGAENVTVKVLFKLISEELKIDIRTLELNEVEKLYLYFQKKVNTFRIHFASAIEERTHWAYSIDKAKNEFGYAPKTNLRTGIAYTLHWANQEGLLKA
jgi:nucleoside-diphosphate-sugar epimerase